MREKDRESVKETELGLFTAIFKNSFSLSIFISNFLSLSVSKFLK